jgi:hypothetical protein
MSELFGTPITGTVAPDTFEPILPAEQIDQTLVEHWRAYLTDCLKNNFSLMATISVSDSGGTVLWVPRDRQDPHGKEKLLHEFAKECLRDFIKHVTGGSRGGRAARA